MDKVIKTSFEEEQQKKDDAFLKLTPLERLAHAYKVRQQMHKAGVDYSFAGKKVKVTWLS